MRVLKKKVQKAGLVKELRQRQYYEKPCDKRNRKKKEMTAAWKKKQKKLNTIKSSFIMKMGHLIMTTLKSFMVVNLTLSLKKTIQIFIQ